MDNALGDGFIEQAACRLCFLLCSYTVTGLNSIANGTGHGLQLAFYGAIAHARLLIGFIAFLLTLDICHFFVPFGFLRHPSQWGFDEPKDCTIVPVTWRYQVKNFIASVDVRCQFPAMIDCTSLTQPGASALYRALMLSAQELFTTAPPTATAFLWSVANSGNSS